MHLLTVYIHFTSPKHLEYGEGDGELCTMSEDKATIGRPK